MTVSDLRVLVDNLDEYIHIAGGIARLKKTVLHLAVSGQLVPQVPAEGTGNSLFEQIILEKDKKQSKKTLPEISDEEIPFDIPRSWRWTRVSDLGYALGQKVPGEDFYYIDVASIDNSTQSLKQPALLTANEAPSRARKIVKEGTVIYSTVRPYLLNTTVIQDDFDKELIASTAFAILHPFTGVNSHWILSNLTSQYFTDYTNNKSVGAAYPAINDAQFSMAIMPLPPSAEQIRILNRLNYIFALIDDLDNKYKIEEAERSKFVKSSLRDLSHNGSGLALENLSQVIKTKTDAAELRKAILHLAVSGQLVPQIPSEGTGEDLCSQIMAERKNRNAHKEISDAEIPYRVPKTWAWVRLQEVYMNIAPVTKLKTSDYLENGKYPIIDQGKRHIAGYTNSGDPNIVDTPVIIFGDHTREIKLINFDFIVGADGVKILKPILIEPNFFFMLIDVFRPKSRGYGRHFKMLNEKVVPLPPLAEQHRIVEKTAILLALVEKLEKLLDK
jgi:type I restriction enzyme S subunit